MILKKKKLEEIMVKERSSVNNGIDKNLNEAIYYKSCIIEIEIEDRDRVEKSLKNMGVKCDIRMNRFVFLTRKT